MHVGLEMKWEFNHYVMEMRNRVRIILQEMWRMETWYENPRELNMRAYLTIGSTQKSTWFVLSLGQWPRS